MTNDEARISIPGEVHLVNGNDIYGNLWYFPLLSLIATRQFRWMLPRHETLSNSSMWLPAPVFGPAMLGEQYVIFARRRVLPHGFD